MLRYIFLFSFLVLICSAFPLQPFTSFAPRALSSTSLEHEGWVPEPNGRGTASILRLCYSTLVICAWTAVHPNIPSKESSLRFTLNRIGLLLLAIFFPELILYCAWDQWWAARCFQFEMNRLGEGLNDPDLKRKFVASKSSDCPACAYSELTNVGESASTFHVGENHQNDDAHSDANTGGNSVSHTASSPNAVGNDQIDDIHSEAQTTGENDDLTANTTSPGIFDQREDAPSSTHATSDYMSWTVDNVSPEQHDQSSHDETQSRTHIIRASSSTSAVQSGTNQSPPSGTSSCQEKNSFTPWTMEQAFFVVSGGLAVDVSSFEQTEGHFLSKVTRWTFTPEGIVLLAEIGIFPKLSKEDVKARSNADAIAKALSSLQIFWFFLQCLARVIQGLPLTLLELHTMINVVLGLAMYAIWFKKAYVVSTPMLCDDPPVVNMAAFLALRGERDLSGFDNDHNVWINPPPPDDSDDDESNHEGPEGPPPERMWISGRNYTNLEEANIWHLSIACSVQDSIGIEMSQEAFNSTYDTSQAGRIEINPQWAAANEAIRYIRTKGLHFTWTTWLGLHRRRRFDYYDRSNFLVRNWSNFHIKGAFRSTFGYKKPHALLRNSFCVVCFVYGASHLSAWAFEFPTRVEMWLWRSFAIMMAGAPLLAGLVFLGGPEDVRRKELRKSKRRSDPRKRDRVRRWLEFALFGFRASGVAVLALVVGSLFPYVRVFFLVESLVSLRAPANGTYDDVEWARYLPSIF